ncbi:Cell wall-binding protein YocH precursor [compost metagenome]
MKERELHIEQIALINKNNKRKLDYRTNEISINGKWLKFEVTAYTNGYESTRKRRGHKDYGRTASGVITKEGRTVSADPNILPIGTIIYIDGVGKRRVEDTGSAIKGYKLDLFIEDLQEAKNFGRKIGVKVKIIKLGKGKIE